MSKNIDTGGMAFPTEHIYNGHGVEQRYSEQGMTLLDYFAAKIIQGRVAGRCAELGNGSFNDPTCEGLAQVSYKLARAMLAEKRRIENEQKH